MSDKIWDAQEFAFNSWFEAGVNYARNFMKDEFKDLKTSEFPKVNNNEIL